MTLEQLKTELLADGIIDAAEVVKLKEMFYADGIIDKAEAEFLFEVNNAVSGKKNDASWGEFFIQAIADFLLKDKNSPGEIDVDEALWLIEKIGADGKVDDIERKLLEKLERESKVFPDSLKNLLK